MEERKESWRSIVSVLFLVYLTPIAAIPVWLISNWSKATKWVVTAISIIAIVLLYMTSYSGYKMSKFEEELSPVVAVQQALDLYGLSNGEYPQSLDQVEGKYIDDIPQNKITEYAPSADGSSYTLKAQVEGKNVELGPALKNIE